MLKIIEIITTALLVIFLVIFFVVIRAITVRGDSMTPNYQNGDTYLANKLAYSFSAPQRGDVVIYIFSQKPDYEIVNRIVGLPGEKIMIKDGKVHINGQPLSENYLPSNSTTKTSEKREFNISGQEGELAFKVVPGSKILDEGQEFQIPADNYFMMGDNRIDSVDSRDLGLVEKKNIKAKLVFKYKI